jgi:hypothetical protein
VIPMRGLARSGGIGMWMGRILTLSVRTAFLVFLLAFLSPVGGSWPASELSAQLSLVVEAEQGGQRFLCLPVRPGEEFQIEFLHSYDRFPFKELYRVEKDGRIRLLKMVFRSMLNGQGFVYPGARIRPDGWGEIDDIPSVNDRVEFIMGAREHANHRLTLRGVEYTLSDTISPGTVVMIKVQEDPCDAPSAADLGKFGYAR